MKSQKNKSLQRTDTGKNCKIYQYFTEIYSTEITQHKCKPPTAASYNVNSMQQATT